jgi:NAD(P)-dependent dehydrogenase (short-subunit alcohol dehydrogenase family)
MRDQDPDSELDPKCAVVVGGTGEVGTGIVRALAAAGFHVVVPSRSQAKIDALRAALDGAAEISAVVTDVTTVEGVAKVRETLLVPPELLVVSLGVPPLGGPLVSVGPDTFDRLLIETVGAQYRVARGFAALVASGGGVYATINGPAVLQAVPGSGPIALAAAAQLALREILTVELPSLRALDLVVATPMRTRSRGHPRPHWLSPEDVGRVLLRAMADPRIHGATLVVDRRADGTGEPELSVLERVREPFPLRP